MEISEMPTEETKRIPRHQMLKEYGENLRQRRKERGITRIELSERAGVSCEDIESAERGMAVFTEQERQRIAKFLSRQRII
ncbi:MAG: helix-turn-helix transcriptional regulator [Candidatus Omnitrophota bacterium]